MWNTLQTVGRYAIPTSWLGAPKKSSTVYPTTSSTPKHIAVGITIATILNKLTPWDVKGYVKRILLASSEEVAVAIFAKIMDTEGFLTLLKKGRQALGATDQQLLLKFFAEMADKYPKYNLYASVTTIIVQLG